MNKILPITAAALICTTGLALAAENPSGRPGQILSKSQCQQAWDAAGPESNKLSEAKATPYVLNFDRVDTSNDREISQDEWQAGCNKGWVSADARQVSPKQNKPMGKAKKFGKSDASNSGAADTMSSEENNSSY